MTKRNPARIGPRPARMVLAPALGLALTGSMLVAPVAGADSDGPTSADSARMASGSDGESYQVTLITGDVVHWNVVDGHGWATIMEANAGSAFQTIEDDDGYYVIPAEVSALVGHSLDRELFNITGLVEQGYHDGAVNGVPVIVESNADSSMGAASAVPGLTVERRLSSIGAVAGQIAHEDTEAFGDVLAQAATADGGDFGTASLGGMGKIWLDEQVQVSLEDSVPQTGAPQAWASGFDGTGVTIAILDTGIDETHADIGDKVIAAENFTDSDSTTDRHGHGTHVAATAAGTGDASDGLRTGVAPGADLVNGKVLNDAGGGPLSGIIAGMEWAAADQDADVINMSLGGNPSDGTDPLSLALDALSEQHGALFVVSAGNSGPGQRTVTSPATAEAALSVGAVDKNSELAWFSSRGPRPGDYAINPHITAPGVSIVAARAAGSTMGSPVDANYTSANGTSMAAPHVAGAAAILAQQHPDWDPETLKAGLINSANPHEALTVYQQGGGELDVARAVDAPVVATPGTLDLGAFEYPHDDADPVTQTLTYTNHGEDTLVLDVEVSMVDEEGTPAAEGMVTLEPSTLSLEPGASAQVEVTLDRSLGEPSLYSGSIVATDADGQRVGTPAGFFMDSERYDLTIEGVQRNGEPAAARSGVAVIDAIEMGAFGRSNVQFIDGVATLRVPPGTYSVMSMITTLGGGPTDVRSQAMLGDPEIEITEDTHLVFDARDADEITVDTPYDDVTLEGNGIQYRRESAEAGAFSQGWTGGTWPLYVSGTDPVSLGGFDFASQFELSAPGVWMDLNYPEFDAIPADPSYEVNDETVATVHTAYHSDTPAKRYSRSHAARNPWESTGLALLRYLHAPLERVEHYSANETRFRPMVTADPTFGGNLAAPETGYQPGEQLEQSWHASPNTPSLNEGNEYTQGELPTRSGDTLALTIFEFGDSNPGDQVHYGYRNPRGDDTISFRLHQDGEVIAEAARAFGNFTVAPGESRLRLELDVAREADWWTTSTQTRTAWEFDSATKGAPKALPLLQIDYDIDLDLSNQVLHPRDTRGPFTIGLDVRQPRGVQTTEIQEVKVWLSYDDGATWRERPVRSTGEGSFEAVVDRRGGGGHASIKVEARDADGNTIEQEVIRAYKTRP